MVDNYEGKFNVTQGDTSGIDAVGKLNKELEKAQGNTLKVSKYTNSLSDQYAKLRREKAPEELARKYAELAAETGNSRTALLQLNAELRKIDATNEEITKVARTFDREYTAAVKRAEQATQRLRDEQERQSKEGLILNARKATLSRDNIGDISTFTSEAAGLVPGAGGQALRGVADITGLLEYSSNFQQAVKNAGLAAQNASGLVGKFASAGTAVAAVIPGVSASFGALVGVAAPFVLAAGGIALAIAAVSQRMEEARKQGEEYANNIALGIKAQVEVNRLIQAGNAEGVTDLVNNKKAEYEIARDNLNLLYEEKARLEAENKDGINNDKISGVQQQINELIPTFNEAKIGYQEVLKASTSTAAVENQLAADRENAARTQIELIKNTTALLASGIGTKELNAEIAKLTTGIDTNRAAMKALREQGLEDTDTFRQLADEEKNLSAQRAELTSVTSRQIAADNDLLASKEEQLKIDKALADFRRNEASEALQDSLAASDAAVDAVNKEADAKFDLNRRLVQQQLAHNENLANIAKRGNEQVAQLQEQLASKITANNAAIGKLQDDYQKSETKAREEYLRRRNAIEQAADQSALDAKINNDATALARIRAQEQADLGELDTGEQLRADEAKAQLEERVATLRAETEAFKVEIANRIIETQNQTTAAIAEAQKQYDARLKLDEEERRIKEQRAERDAQLAEQRRVRNEQLEQAAQDAALASTLAGITAKSEAELAAMQAAIDAALTFEQVGIRLQSSFGGLLQSVTNPVTKALENAYNGGADKPYTQSSGYDPYQGVLPPIPTGATTPPTPTSTPFAPSAIPSNTQLPNSLIPTLDKVASSAPPPNVYITVESPTVGDVASKSVATAIAEEIADKVAAKYQKITVDGIRIGNRKAATRRS